MLFNVLTGGTSQADNIINMISKITTAIYGWITEWISVVFTAGNEILLFSLCLPVIAIALTIFLRMLRKAKM